jgi:hypothetical protein
VYDLLQLSLFFFLLGVCVCGVCWRIVVWKTGGCYQLLLFGTLLVITVIIKIKRKK